MNFFSRNCETCPSERVECILKSSPCMMLPSCFAPPLNQSNSPAVQGEHVELAEPWPLELGRVAQVQQDSHETEREAAYPSSPLSWEVCRDPSIRSNLSSYLLPAEELIFMAATDS